jgi:transcription elongation factor GreA
VRERRFLTSHLEAGGSNGDAFESQWTLMCFANEMCSIEKQTHAGCIRFARERAIGADDWILTTVDSFHVLLLSPNPRTTEPSNHHHPPTVSQAPYVKVEFIVKDRILKRFTDEIAALERELKVDLPREIQRAREYGDLRENAEYKAAKERQGIVDARISMLKKRVSEIQLMNLDRIPRDKAAFGSTVHLRDQGGAMLVYQLVMPEDADAEKGMISTASPIGRAILNKEEGDEIKVITPGGTKTFELIKLSTIHDADS